MSSGAKEPAKELRNYKELSIFGARQLGSNKARKQGS